MISQKISSPTLLLDSKKCKTNIKKMLNKAQTNNISLRPHFKTHQSADVAKWYRELGITKAAVSSMKMAEYFVKHNWNDLLLAFPFNPHEAQKANELNNKIDLNILLVSKEVIDILEQTLDKPINVFVEIDTGYQRTGIDAEEIDTIAKLLEAIKQSEKLIFKGFQIHNGHTYLKGKKEIEEIHLKSLQLLKKLREHFIEEYPNLVVSLGDTPACSITNNFEGIDEIRPGNFVFYDLVQWQTGSCDTSDIAVALAAPVVFKNAKKNTVTVHGGAIHLSKDFYVNQENDKVFGLPVELNEDSWGEPIKGGKVISVSQEHGTIELPTKWMSKFEIGDFIGILPAHSCLATQLQAHLLTTEGELFEVMPK